MKASEPFVQSLSHVVNAPLYAVLATARFRVATFIALDLFYQQHPSHLMFPDIDSIDLADPQYNVRDRIDGFIGAEILSRHLMEGIRRNSLGLMAQATTFGWIVFGGTPTEFDDDPLKMVNLVTANDIYSRIRKLWEMDETNDPPPMSSEDIECESLYQRTVVKENDRYQVTLLLEPIIELGESRTMARRRLYCLENRFRKDPELKTVYVRFMKEYEELGHMRRAEQLAANKLHYYIPHHAVAVDRHFRVVFDASAKTTNGKSLNDAQYTGPRL